MRSIAILAACTAITIGVAPMIAQAQTATTTTSTSNTISPELKTMWEKIEGSWQQTKGAVKEQWGKLTDDDFDVVAGRRDQLAGKIQERYGVAKEDAEKQVAEWQRSASDAWFVTEKDRR